MTLPAHRTRGVSVEPRGHALLAEDVFAVQHRGLVVRVLADRAETSACFHLVFTGSFPVPADKEDVSF